MTHLHRFQSTALPSLPLLTSLPPSPYLPPSFPLLTSLFPSPYLHTMELSPSLPPSFPLLTSILWCSPLSCIWPFL